METIEALEEKGSWENRMPAGAGYFSRNNLRLFNLPVEPDLTSTGRME